MKVRVTEDCVVCGKCEEICPEVFKEGDDIAQVLVDKVPPDKEDAVREAAGECPSEAIIIEE